MLDYRCHNHHQYSEVDADLEAIADLTRQVKDLKFPMTTIVRARRDQLKAEVQAERGFKRSITKARKDLIDMFEQASLSADPELLLNLDDDQLLNFVLRGGLGLAVDDFIESQEKIRSSVERSLEAVGVDLSLDAMPQLDLIQTQAANAVFEDVIIPDFKRAMSDALTSMSLELPMDVVKSELAQRLERSEGRQLTEIKTTISQYGRTITAVAAQQAGLEHYLYTGPRDGLTRSFCRALINKVVSEDQMRKLKNGQGLSVKTSGGGYNCRHSWSPVSESFIEAADLDLATSSDIRDANRGGAR